MLKCIHLFIESVIELIVGRLFKSCSLYNSFNKLSCRLTKSCRAIENESYEGVFEIVKKKLCRIYLNTVIEVVILSLMREIFLIFIRIERLLSYGQIALGRRLCYLNVICEKILHKEPGRKNLSLILFIKDTHRRSLGYHFRRICIILRYLHYNRFKINKLILGDVYKGRIRSYLGCACCRVYCKNTLSCIKEVCGIA